MQGLANNIPWYISIIMPSVYNTYVYIIKDVQYDIMAVNFPSIFPQNVRNTHFGMHSEMTLFFKSHRAKNKDFPAWRTIFLSKPR